MREVTLIRLQKWDTDKHTIFAFGLTAKLSPKAKEDIFDPAPVL
jgi:hypothetical protein